MQVPHMCFGGQALPQMHGLITALQMHASSRTHDTLNTLYALQINIGGGHQLETRRSLKPSIPSTVGQVDAGPDAAADAQPSSSSDQEHRTDFASQATEPVSTRSTTSNKKRKLHKGSDSATTSPAGSQDVSDDGVSPSAHCKPSDAKQKVSTRNEARDSVGAEGSDGGQVRGNDWDNRDEEDEDDLLVVKRRDVLDSSNPAAEGADDGIPLGGVELRGNKKRKRVKIDPGKMSGARTVFDEEGESLQPLALLAKEQLDRSGQSFVPTASMCCPL